MPRRKLTRHDRYTILELVLYFGVPIEAVQRLLGVSRPTVRKALLDQVWSAYASCPGTRHPPLTFYQLYLLALMVGSRAPVHGSRHGRAKLCEEKVEQIRADYARGETVSSLARRFSISRTNVRRIVNREIWNRSGAPQDRVDAWLSLIGRAIRDGDFGILPLPEPIRRDLPRDLNPELRHAIALIDQAVWNEIPRSGGDLGEREKLFQQAYVCPAKVACQVLPDSHPAKAMAEGLIEAGKAPEAGSPFPSGYDLRSALRILLSALLERTGRDGSSHGREANSPS